MLVFLMRLKGVAQAPSNSFACATDYRWTSHSHSLNRDEGLGAGSDPFKRTVDRFLGVRRRNVEPSSSFCYGLTKHVFICDDLFRAKDDFRTHAFPFFRLPHKYFSGGRMNCSIWFVRSIERNSQQRRVMYLSFCVVRTLGRIA